MHIVTRMVRLGKYSGIFFYLTILTGFFLLLELSFFITCNKVYLVDFTHVATDLTIPYSALPAMFFFIFIEIALHFLYVLSIWFSTILISKLLHLDRNQYFILSVGLWVMGIVTILLLNLYLFPNSKFSQLLSVVFFNQTIINIFLYPLVVMCLLTIMLAAIQLFFDFRYLTIIFFICLFSSYFIINHPSVSVKDGASNAKPNIIIIGVDALRPDFLAYFGNDKSMPFFDSFLKEATVFSEALTPLARTFPSWTSILTGQYPFKNGVRFNLTNPAKIHLADTLPSILRNHGYLTFYATDETRFSNIDHYFGFDEIITAPMGLNDFIVGTFNDFPLSNLLVNTKVGKWLFPYSYGNRGVYFTYETNTFLQRLRPFIESPRSKPLFLSVHFCLTHFPNLWAELNAKDLNPLAIYQASVDGVGQQIQAFIDLLKQNKVLDHAILVLLSDHGEGLALVGDRITEPELFMGLDKNPVPKFYPPSLDGEGVNQSAGHGTDVLGLAQYHVLLAVKLYGLETQKVQVIHELVTLLDIKPTILDLLNIKGAFKRDGVSLAGSIIGGKNNETHPKHIFIESDYSPESIRTVYPETRKVMLDGIKLFTIDPISTRLIIKDEMGKMIIASKQYADIYGDWILALYPQNKEVRMPILVNLKTGEWTNDLNSKFAQTSPAQTMLAALKSFYGSELTGI